jgi:hypothetical protein
MTALKNARRICLLVAPISGVGYFALSLLNALRWWPPLTITLFIGFVCSLCLALYFSIHLRFSF